jgi:hypothetical protein
LLPRAIFTLIAPIGAGKQPGVEIGTGFGKWLSSEMSTLASVAKLRVAAWTAITSFPFAKEVETRLTT